MSRCHHILFLASVNVLSRQRNRAGGRASQVLHQRGAMARPGIYSVRSLATADLAARFLVTMHGSCIARLLGVSAEMRSQETKKCMKTGKADKRLCPTIMPPYVAFFIDVS